MSEQRSDVKILVADDEPEVVDLVRMMLEWQGGYRVLGAGDGEEALERARSDSPDLILLDVRMPRKNGLDALHDLKADPALASVPVIMLSVVTTYPEVQSALRQGAVAYLPKPFELKEMVRLVERVLVADPAGRLALQQQALENIGKP
ncbi:MAG: response regulator [Anaerolineae bacterium]|nr:response regulator [Anaerolineae bacterium]MDX9828760.1 response regulator [Anaerolineae bacterium]